MNTRNKIGYIVLALGLLLITGTLYCSYLIFTGKAVPPTFVHAPNTVLQNQVVSGQGSLEQQLQLMVRQQIVQLLPVNAVTQVINYMIWSFLAMIFIWGGSHIAKLGISLIE